ncbi:MAG: hypothetical protein ACREJ0_13740, partial [Geminicoccaceae bacterium]
TSPFPLLPTPMTALFFANPEFHARTVGRMPLGRVGDVEHPDGRDPVSRLRGLGPDDRHLIIDSGWTAI